MTQAHYSIIRYVADPARSEQLNVGILLWSGDSYRLDLDEKAVARVIRENPRLERDSLLYLGKALEERIASSPRPISAAIGELIEHQSGFPVALSEPRFTTVAADAQALDAAMGDLVGRIVRPRRRGRRTADPRRAVAQRLRPLIKKQLVTENYFFNRSMTEIRRRVDFFANSRAMIAADVLRLAITRAEEIRLRADAEAFKILDLRQENSDVRFLVYCDLSDDARLREPNQNALRILETAGAEVLTDEERVAQEVFSAVAA